MYARVLAALFALAMGALAQDTACCMPGAGVSTRSAPSAPVLV